MVDYDSELGDLEEIFPLYINSDVSSCLKVSDMELCVTRSDGLNWDM